MIVHYLLQLIFSFHNQNRSITDENGYFCIGAVATCKSMAEQRLCKRRHLTLQYAVFYRLKRAKSEDKRQPFARHSSSTLIISDLQKHIAMQ